MRKKTNKLPFARAALAAMCAAVILTACPTGGGGSGGGDGGTGGGSNTGGSSGYTVSTLAGDGTYTSADGTGTAAKFAYPTGVTVDSAGNVYVTDRNAYRIRKITSAAVVTTIAGGTQGYADGTGTAAQFDDPAGVAVDSAGSLYVADSLNHRIRKITSGGVVTTVAGDGTAGYADGTGTAAKFNKPYGVTIDSAGNLYVTEIGGHRVRKITSGGVVTTVAGDGTAAFADGTGTAAQFNTPYGVTVDGAGNLYVIDSYNHRIRKITSGGEATTIAGDGTAAFADGTGQAARFNEPRGAAVDSAGNVYIADYYNHRIRKMTPQGAVTTIAGSGTAGYADGTGTAAKFNGPTGVAVDSAGNLYVADMSNNRIRKLTPAR